jgi:geranylgeranyl reductase family protein
MAGGGRRQRVAACAAGTRLRSVGGVTSLTHDAVVVGAGPAGALAALHLARRGLRVLVLEKAAAGRDKPCGGGLTVRSWRDLEVPIDDLVVSRVDGAELRCGPRRSAHVPLGDRGVLMVRRRDLDRRLGEAAEAAGAEVHHCEPAAAVEPDGVTVEVRTARRRYRAAAVLLATGAEAPLRSALGLPPPAGTMAVAVELEGPAQTAPPDDRSLVFDYDLPGGYAWAFPKTGHEGWWNAGVVTGRPGLGPQLRGRLARFLDEVGLRFESLAPERATGRRIPFWGGSHVLHRGRVALLGDAAGLADPFFGEGIATALASGRLAAQAVAELVCGESADLAGYSSAVDATLGGHLRRMRYAARIVYSAPGVTLRAVSSSAPVRRLVTRAATESLLRSAPSR